MSSKQEKGPKTVKVKGKKVKAGKVQHLKVGQEYTVTEEKAKMLKANGQAE
tara:strand:- start:60 stop:212 length:153 start_codon:yes stop_codon:yes gene_type:complete